MIACSASDAVLVTFFLYACMAMVVCMIFYLTGDFFVSLPKSDSKDICHIIQFLTAECVSEVTSNISTVVHQHFLVGRIQYVLVNCLLNTKLTVLTK